MHGCDVDRIGDHRTTTKIATITTLEIIIEIEKKSLRAFYANLCRFVCETKRRNFHLIFFFSWRLSTALFTSLLKVRVFYFHFCFGCLASYLRTSS